MSNEDTHIYDVLIVGGGPCGLAVAARLRESTPSSLFTDSEHQRYHWMKASLAKKTSKPFKTSRRSHTARDRLIQGASCPECLDIAVLDAHGDNWMSAWNERFEKLRITHLRSPMFFHPDPQDRDALRGYAWREGKEHELKEISGVIGKELSKHQRKQNVKKGSGKRQQETTYLDERDRLDYFRPSTTLFRNFCEDIACRYDIADIVEKSEVQKIDYEPSECGECPGTFILHTSTGKKFARTVVFAAGAALSPTVPSDCPFSPVGSVCHALVPSSGPNETILPPAILRKISLNKQTNLLIVGGGLTSAQIADHAIKSGVTNVYQTMRGPLKIKDFDMELGWVAKFKNVFLAQFWGLENDTERLEMYKKARNGGSVNPEYHHILKSHIASSRLVLHEHTDIASAVWDPTSHSWTEDWQV
ncbi:FAD binding domain-containing protein [Rutstroemia sp. NJR-2017a WRK4]|nr:FAD binding domain-containing protein [Rutstroemia sp. NJR-2017a WRK4]